jgi:uncharacterized protein (DUF2384 family)
MKDREHDSAMLFAEIESVAIKIIGSTDIAINWMTRNNLALGDTPLSMSYTEAGACDVRKVLSSIARGGVV